MSGGQFAKTLRDKVIELYKQHDTGLAFTQPQIEALMDLTKAMTLVSIQKEVERKHFDLYNNKHSWYEYRATLLGYSTKSLIEAMQKVNQKHSTIRTSLMKLDATELIRTGVIDFMIALGKTQDYALNVGNMCKSIAERSEYANIIWYDTKENPLRINQESVQQRKEIYSNTKLLS